MPKCSKIEKIMKNKASLHNKIYRKLHWFFFLKIKPGRWEKSLYPAYRRGKRYAKRHGKDITELVNETEEPSDIYMTQAPNVGAGIGHQMANYIGGYHYSMRYKTKHAYIPFGDQAWEEFLGFGKGEVTLKQLKKEGYIVKRLPYFDDDKDYIIIKNIVDSYRGKKIVLRAELDQFYKKQYDVIPHIKEKFENADARKNDKLIFNADEMNIAVHIRRGDINIGQVTGEATLTKRWLDLDYYEKAIEKVLNINKPDKPVHVYIFSQDEDDYSRFEKFGKVTKCIEMSAMESFIHMVRADVLIMSKSSFSYKPALLADGIRVCPSEFWHEYPDDGRWIVME